MPHLSEIEFDITRELISIALANSADAFSKMANEKVLITDFSLSFIESQQLSKLIPNTTENIHVLTTHVKGKLDGKSYLLFTDSDVKKVFNVFLGRNNYQENEKLDELQQAILLELDNILSAAMVTQISNFLALFCYGDVPHIETCNAESLQQKCLNETQHFDVTIGIQAQFKTYHTNMNPTFIWFFTSDFITAIKNLINNKPRMSLLKETNTGN